MALKRLDEEFDLKPGTQLLPYMQRLLPSLEGRFQALETERKTFDMAVEDMREVALRRINEILIPATEDIIKVTTLGFLLGPSTSSVLLELGLKTFTVTEGPQRTSFTPSPYVLVERTVNADDYAIARVLDYDNVTGALILNITAFHGDPGPHNDWMISSTPGMADSTKLYHDEVAPMRDEVAADTIEVNQARDQVVAAANALFAAGLDVQAFIRRDGTTPFVALQTGVHPAAGANDAYLATTAWSRARMIEYAAVKMNRSGDTMTGALLLSGPPTSANMAVTKAYADALIGQGGTILGQVTFQFVNPTIRLQTTGTGQNRIIEGRSQSGITRWQLQIGDAGAEGGNNSGSQFAVLRYNDFGAYLDTPFWINRQDGTTSLKGLSYSGSLSGTGNVTIAGDLVVYRPNTTTGVVFLNNPTTAYLFFNGSTYTFPSYGASFGGPLSCGALTCTTINTQNNGITVGGITNTGSMTAAGAATVAALTINSAANYITLYDNDWGPMYIHHNADLCGFLNNGGGWAMYVTNAGHIWSTQYGYLHDYVSSVAYGAANGKDAAINNAQNTANDAWNRANNAQGSANNAQGTANNATNLANNAQSSANTAQGTATNATGLANNAQAQANYATGLAQYAVNLCNQRVEGVRLVYAGGPGINTDGNYHEDVTHAVITGYAAGRGGYIGNFVYRYIQINIGGNFYTVGYAD